MVLPVNRDRRNENFPSHQLSGFNREIPDGPTLVVEKKLIDAPELTVTGVNGFALQLVYTS